MAIGTLRTSVLITGGCGFIGVNLGKALVAANQRVAAYDNLTEGSLDDARDAGYEEVIVGDLLDADALSSAMEGVDAVVHLAAQTSVIESIAAPVDFVRANVEGTASVLEAARHAGVRRVVFASSNAPLGDAEPPTHEGIVPRPASPYGASKLAGEALCSAFAGSYGMSTTALRFSNVYGPFSYHKGSVIAKFFRSIYANEPLVVYGDGQQTRDFVYVKDLCEGIVAALDAPFSGYELVHLGTGTESTIQALVTELLQLFPDRDIEVRHEPARAGEIVRNYSDISKARRLLGYAPKTSLQDGLRATMAWFEEQI